MCLAASVAQPVRRASAAAKTSTSASAPPRSIVAASMSALERPVLRTCPRPRTALVAEPHRRSSSRTHRRPAAVDAVATTPVATATFSPTTRKFRPYWSGAVPALTIWDGPRRRARRRGRCHRSGRVYSSGSPALGATTRAATATTRAGPVLMLELRQQGEKICDKTLILILCLFAIVQVFFCE